jgi:hypothetical protein
MPLQPRHGYAADLRRGLPAGDIYRRGSSPHLRCGYALQPSPHLPGSSWWFALERLSDADSSRTPSRHACRTRAIWQCWPVPALSGLLAALPLVPGIVLPSASPARCDEPEEEVSHLLSVHGASWRSMSQLQTWFGAVAISSGFLAAGWVA